MQQVFIAGGTGDVGRPLIRKLCSNGARIRAVARAQSANKLPPGCDGVIGNVLDAYTYQDHVPAGSTFVHLVGVAHPAPVMKAFIEVRVQCEEVVRKSGLPSSIVRPWYILGPGHYWPYLLLPVYKMLEAIPASREVAARLGLVTLSQMVDTLVAAIASPPNGVRVLETNHIRGFAPARQVSN